MISVHAEAIDNCRNRGTSVLQVVRNPGWLIPYIACMVVSLGMIMHFALTLSKFVKKFSAAA